VNIYFGSGTSTVNVWGTGVTTNLFNYGPATIYIDNNYTNPTIQGALNLENEPSFDTINIDDSLDTVAPMATIDTVTRPDDTSLGRLQGISAPITWDYRDTSAVIIYFGPGTSVVNVLGTGVPTTLNGSAAGNNTLVGADLSTTWNITGANAGNFSNADASASFAGYQNLTGGSGDDTFVFGNGASLSGTLDGGGGSNTIDSSAYSTGEFFAITGANAGFGTPVGAFANIQNLLGGGAGGNYFYFADGASLSGTLDGGSGGNNTLDSSAYSTGESFVINGANDGFGTPVAAFANIQTLIGGAGNNSFAFSDGGSLDGGLNGGSGAGNTLDYSTGWTGSVLVDLQTGAASGIAGLGAGAVTGIQNVVGASGGAAGTYNLLIGNGGNVLTGGFGRRNILVAGGSASTLLGGDNEDLLIGGTTLYDTEAGLASWQAIAAYWAGADDYGTRADNLTAGIGVPLLDATTVIGNGGGNTLIGTGEWALIYTDGLDNFTPPGFDPNSRIVPIAP
jgi:hypothetical protein